MIDAMPIARRHRRRGALSATCALWVLLWGHNPNAAGSDNAHLFFTSSTQLTLAQAVVRGDTAELDYLLSQGADVNTSGRDNVTVLCWAVMQRSKAGVSYLLAHGADPNRRIDGNGTDPDLPTMLKGSSAVSIAARLEDQWFIKILAAHGADINLQNSIGREPPIIDALASMRDDNVRLLISLGANLNVQDRFGFTPLATAIGTQRFELAYDMLMAGADPRIHLNSRGITVLTILRQAPIPTTSEVQWRLKVIEVLREKGLDVQTGK